MYKTVIINQNTKNSKVSKQFKEMLIEKQWAFVPNQDITKQEVYCYFFRDHKIITLKLENIKCTILGLYNAKQVDSVPLSEFTLLGIHMLPLFSLQVNLISRRVLLQLMIVCVIFVKHIFHCTSWFGTNAHCFSINISLNCII
jgi:hypothetical protein